MLFWIFFWITSPSNVPYFLLQSKCEVFSSELQDELTCPIWLSCAFGCCQLLIWWWCNKLLDMTDKYGYTKQSQSLPDDIKFLQILVFRNLECVEPWWALCSQMNWVSSYDLLLEAVCAIQKKSIALWNRSFYFTDFRNDFVSSYKRRIFMEDGISVWISVYWTELEL